MGVCASQKPSKDPNDPNKPKEPPVHQLANFLQYQFDQLKTTLQRSPPVNEKPQNNIGDQIVPSKQQKLTLNQFDTIQIIDKIFEDAEFKANQASLTSNTAKFEVGRNVEWRRPKEFFNNQENFYVFEGKIEPNDIKQGQLGDCYFLSVLSVMAEHPNLIESLFVAKETQPNGRYAIWLCKDGEFSQVVIDDQIPCTKGGGPIFSKANKNELWVLLMEKAYAKIHGSYQTIESGLAGHAFRDLTGASSSYLIMNQKDGAKNLQDCLNFLNENRKNKSFLLAASSSKNPNGVEIENPLGIVSSHCYSILDCQPVTDQYGKSDQIIKMRNPWGRKEWTGKWSDQSGAWTPELKARLKFEAADDGIFWIGVQDFIQHFSQICVAKVHPGYKYLAFKLLGINTNTTNRFVVTMQVFQKSHLYLTLTQKDLKGQPNAKYSLCRMIIGRIDNNIINSYVGDKFDNDRDNTIEGTFDEGFYAIYIEVDWEIIKDRDLTISSYGEYQVAFTETKMDDATITQILDGLLRVHQHFSEKEKQFEYDQQIRRVECTVGGYLYSLYENKSENSTLHETQQFTDMEHVALCPPFQLSNEYTVHVKPKSTILVKLRVMPTGSGAFSKKSTRKYHIDVSYSSEQLLQLALTQPTKTTERQMNNQPIGVTIYSYEYNSGNVMVYQNKSQQIYSETITFQLTNMEIVNQPGNSVVKVELQPQGQQMVELRVVDMSKGSGMQMKSSYSIK